MYKEQKRRSVLKAFSWRALATMTTAVIVFVFTGEAVLAISIGGVEAFAKMFLYFLHERAWDKVSFGKKEIKPFVLWFTGLSGSGKSTLADETYEYLKQKGLRVERLDGDVVRDVFPKTGFSREERDAHVKRIGFLASMLERNGVIVIASFISPYREARGFVRSSCQDFIEVFVDTSLDECEKRDVKGLYQKARKGEIKSFTGIDDPYEKPENAELTIKTQDQTVEQSFNNIKGFLETHLRG